MMWCYPSAMCRGLLALSCLSFGASYAAEPDAEKLSDINQQMQRLQNELDESRKQHETKPRTVYLNHRSEKEYPYADYLMVVRERMQRIGIEHYASLGLDQLKAPSKARVSITLNHDGRVAQIQFLGLAGDKTVESAVRTIVNMAQPFVPFPTAIKRETDKLVFTNSWQFVPGPTAK
jgi:protein TonB